MKLAEALQGVQKICIETAPLIYFIEKHPKYFERMRSIMAGIDAGTQIGVASVVTLTEVLTQPIKTSKRDIERAYRDILLHSQNFLLLPVDAPVALRAAELRAQYNLKTPDALQIAVAIEAECDAFLTNDLALQRVQEIRILVLDHLEIDLPADPS